MTTTRSELAGDEMNEVYDYIVCGSVETSNLQNATDIIIAAVPQDLLLLLAWQRTKVYPSCWSKLDQTMPIWKIRKWWAGCYKTSTPSMIGT